MADRESRVPAPDEVATAATAALDRTVRSAVLLDGGTNAVYRVSFDDGPDAAMKVATHHSGPRLLAGPVLLDRVARETSVPVPEVWAIVGEAESPIGAAYFLMDYVEGRRTRDTFELPPSAYERLVREAGRHLAALHELPYEGPYGWLRAEGGDLAPEKAFDTWSDALPSLIDHSLERVDERVADLRPAFRRARDDLPDVVDERTIDRSILFWDYKPANLVLHPDDSADPLVRAVVDFNYRPVGDAPLDVAIAETTLVDLPLWETERAAVLRHALRDAYLDERTSVGSRFFDDRYPYYRLLPILMYAKYFDYFATFPRGRDKAAVERWMRTFVRDRLDQLE